MSDSLSYCSRYDGEGMLLRFRDELVLPFAPVLRAFSPLGEGPLARPAAPPAEGV